MLVKNGKTLPFVIAIPFTEDITMTIIMEQDKINCDFWNKPCGPKRVIKCKEWKISLVIIVIPLLRGYTG
jgi:hypothetical protein